jgi:hypothetical protein
MLSPLRPAMPMGSEPMTPHLPYLLRTDPRLDEDHEEDYALRFRGAGPHLTLIVSVGTAGRV